MDEVENPKFEELCRLCAVKTPMDLAMNIYENEGTIRQISKKICTCLPIQVDEMDELPKIICENCLYKLELCYDFRESSAQAGKLLIEIYKKLNSTRVQNDPIDHNELMIVQPRQLLNDGDLDLEEGNLNAMQQRQLLGPFNFQYANMEDENSGNDIPLISNEIKCDQQQNKKYDLQNIMDYAETETEDNNVSVDPQLNKIQLDKEINQEMETHEGSDSEHSLFVDEQLYNVSVPRFKIEKIESLAHFYKCTICLAVFTDADVLYSHRKEAHGSCVDDPKIRCDLQQNDLHDIIEHAETRIEENNSFSVDTQLNKIQLNNDCNKEINPKMDAFKNKDSNNTHSIFVNEQLYNTSMPNLIPDEQVIGIKIEKVESYEHSSNTNDSVCSNISGGSYEQKPQLHHEKYFHKCTICLALFTEEDVLRLHKEEAHGACLDNPKEPINGIQHLANVRPLRKKNACPYCLQEVLHFARHLVRKHKGEVVVNELLALPVKDPERKTLLDIIRKQGNYLLNSMSNVIHPMRRTKLIHGEDVENYVACQNCLGFFKKKFLGRHRRNCALRPKNHADKRENHLTGSQMFMICDGEYREFYDSLRIKNEVFKIMRADEVSRVAMKDVLICSYAESLLSKNIFKIKTTISNKMRELGRLLTVLRQMTGVQRLFDILKAEFFDDIISATKVISRYDVKTQTFKASSLALHMGTTLKQVCDIASKMIIEKNQFLLCDEVEQSLDDIQRLRNLIKDHWNSRISNLVLKNLNKAQCGKAKLFPLAKDLIEFQQYVMKEATEACENITKGNQIDKEYRRLSENVLALTLLLNRKRTGEIQYLKFKTYNADISSNQQEECLQSLSESEKLLTKSFKQIITGGKAVLFPESIQKFINVMLSFRNKCVPNTNEYMFADPNTENRWLNGNHVLKKIADQSNIKNQYLFCPTRLRKQIATMLQIINITDAEMEQFMAFIEHTKKTHDDRLSDDVCQIAKLILAINKGRGAQYTDKTLDEMEFSDNVDIDDSDSDTALDTKSVKVKPGKSETITLEQIARMCCSSQLNIYRENGTFSEESLLNCSDSIPSSSGNIKESTLNKKTRKTSAKRNRWTTEQNRIITEYFKTHIENKKPPRKKETEEFIETYKNLFKELNWVKIKAYVYNCYKDK